MGKSPTPKIQIYGVHPHKIKFKESHPTQNVCLTFIERWIYWAIMYLVYVPLY